jgi:L-2-hydroxyglutarate oxidase
LEPHATGIRALHLPDTGIIDFRRVCLALAKEVRARGGDILTSHRVERLRSVGGCRLIVTSRGTVRARYIISCAGLHSDRVVAMSDGGRSGLRIVPFRGSYLTLRPEARHLVRGLIYPVPDPALPFLGVHFTPRIDGDVWIGPNAIPAFAREGYRLGTVSGRDLFAMGAFPGFWRMARRHIGEGWAEIRRASRRAALLKELRSYVPDLGRDDLSPGPSGVRAQAVDRRGELVDDFSFSDSPGIIHVRNAPSPGATASLAIGSYIAERAGQRFRLSRAM